jgi:hypothetical protein
MLCILREKSAEKPPARTAFIDGDIAPPWRPHSPQTSSDSNGFANRSEDTRINAASDV